MSPDRILCSSERWWNISGLAKQPNLSVSWFLAKSLLTWEKKGQSGRRILYELCVYLLGHYFGYPISRFGIVSTLPIAGSKHFGNYSCQFVRENGMKSLDPGVGGRQRHMACYMVLAPPQAG